MLYIADMSPEDVAKWLEKAKPVAPVMVPHSLGTACNCGSCGTEIAVVKDTVSLDALKKEALYCRRCGQRVKWEYY